MIYMCTMKFCFPYNSSENLVVFFGVVSTMQFNSKAMPTNNTNYNCNINIT